MVFSYVLYAISILHDDSLWSPEYRLSAASLPLVKTGVQCLRPNNIYSFEAIAGFMFSRVPDAGAASVSLSMVWCIDIGCRV